MVEAREEIHRLPRTTAAPITMDAYSGLETTAESATPSSFHDGFVALFTAEFERVHRILHRMSGDADLAHDLVQDAFIRLYRRGSMPHVPPAWLVAVALNLYRNARATQQRRRRLLTLERGEHVHSDPAPAPDRALLAGLTKSRVRAALHELSERDRQMLLMRAEGYCYREIAVALEVHEASVGTLLARAVRSFRGHYYDDDADTS